MLVKPDGSPAYSITDAAAQMKTSERTIRRYIKEKYLSAQRFGRSLQWYVSIESVETRKKESFDNGSSD